MGLSQFVLFNGKSDHLRPFVLKAATGLFGVLLAMAVIEMIVLVLGAHGFALPLFIMDLWPKIREGVLKVVHDIR